MSYNPNNPNGQATSANSAPVVVASDQPSIPVDLALTIKALLNYLATPPWMNNKTGSLKVENYGQQLSSTDYGRVYGDIGQIWNSSSSATNNLATGFSPTDSLLNPLAQTSWADSIRARIN